MKEILQNMLEMFGKCVTKMVNFRKYIAIIRNIVVESCLFKIILLFLQNQSPHNGNE